jgi:PAS domain-containing protein
MGVTEKILDGITTVIRMNDKVERLSGVVRNQQEKIESLTERMIRLETMLELALAAKALQRPASRARQIERKP